LYWAGVPKADAGAVAILAPQLGLPETEAAHAAEVLIEGFRAARERRGEPATACDVYLAVQTELSLRHDAVRIAEARAAQVSRSPQGREAAAQRGEAERSVGPRKDGKASEDHQQVSRSEPKASEDDQAGRTWMYGFGWRSPARDGVMGACHALDLPFVFGNLDAPGMPAFAGEGADAQAVAESMMDAWCAFARGEAPWAPYELSRRATFEFGRVRELRNAPF